jgi:serine/threonine protein kinase
MARCINPDCQNPVNPDGQKNCLSCGMELVLLLGGRYSIIEPLGGGGFSRTYIAEDRHKLNEKCVVKQLAPQVQGSNSLRKATELFEQEAQRLQQLGTHPQVPTLYAYFQEDNYLYLVQEYIEKQNLGQELKQRGVFNEVDLRDFLYDLLPVIGVVHKQQIIHRDIKPENLIRRQSDRKFVLIDFGVAKLITSTDAMRAGTSIGSYGYAPFEQINEGKVYPASDLYSLGVTCFHLLTSVSPQDLCMKQGFSWTNNWREHLQQPISSELGKILDKLLKVNYEQRYQSIEEVLQDLNSLSSLDTSIPITKLLPPSLESPESKETTVYKRQFFTKQLLTWAVITSSGGWLLAIALLSFLGTVWIGSGLWLLILGGLIFAQARSIIEKSYLFIIALITTLVNLYIIQNISRGNPLIYAGNKGLIVIGLLVMVAGLLAFIVVGISQLVNRSLS